MSFNGIDLLIIVLVGTLTVLGIRRGFLLGAFDLVVIALGLLVAALFYRRLAAPLVEWGLGQSQAAILAFAVLNVATLVLGGLLGRLLLRPLGRLPWPFFVRWGDGLFGVVPGIVKGLALSAVVVLPLAFVQQPLVLSEQVRASRFADPLVDVGLDALYAAVERYDVDLADFAVLTTRPSGERIELPFTVTTGLTFDAEAEAELLALVNQERRVAGLDPVRLDRPLAEVGRAHSEEMFRQGYFAHDSPITGSPGDRLDAARIPFLLSGENLAYAPSVGVAHDGLMKSPGHRANILNPTFTRVGIGIVRSTDRGLMVSQEFAT